jgi:ubiquinone/menaquinone biosynthesis C-methylase UbiE
MLSTSLAENIDKANAEFWDELCGSWLAVSLGIEEVTPGNLRRFDDAYFSLYPYLPDYFIRESFRGKRVLEIGLGYGTLGQALAEKGCDYHGLDIAAGPVAMMGYRLSQLDWSNWKGKVQIGSVLDIPFKDSTFEYVYSIGCLHHSGDIERSVSEAYRVLKDGGKAVIMLYNKHSFRLLVQVPLMRVLGIFPNMKRYKSINEKIRSLYDTSEDGSAAPHTDFVSSREVRRIFEKFSRVKIDIRNFDNYTIGGKFLLKREWVFNNLARFLGLDLYIRAIK